MTALRLNPWVYNTNDMGDTVNYIVEVTDGVTGCQDYDTVQVIFNSRVVANATSTDSVVCFSDSLALGINPVDSGGIAPHSYQWTSNPVCCWNI